MKDNMKKFNDYIINNRKSIIIFLVILVLMSFIIGYFAFAEDDEYAGKIITNGSVSEIIDGTVNNDGNMDTCTDDGCDNSQNNKIVRNFDSVNYTIDYGAMINEEKTEEIKKQGYNPISYRTIYADVFIPSTLNATLSMNSTSGFQYDDNNSSKVGEYIHARYTLGQILATAYDKDNLNRTDNKFTFMINNIDATNGASIKPIILLYDSNADTEIDIDKENFNLEQYKIGKTEVSISDNEIVKVTGSSVLGRDYNVYLSSGSSELLSDGNRSFSAAIVLGLVKDSNRGFKGKIAPTESTFKLDFSTDGYDSFVIKKPVDESYLYSEKSGFTIKLGNKELPYYSGLTKNTDYANTDKLDIDISKNVSITNIVKKELSNSYFLGDNIDIKIVSEHVFRFDAVRSSTNTSDSTITLKAIDGSSNALSTISFDDIKGEYIGGISNKLNIYDNTSSGISSKPQPSGEAVYNYGEAFYISNTINYGNTTGGSNVSDFTNYIKVDNNAFDILDDSDENTNMLMVNDKALDTDAFSINYYYGKWNSEYITLSENASSNNKCPSQSELENLTPEELMNLYGGPCITINSNVKKSQSIIDTSSDANADYKVGIMFIEIKINEIMPNDKIDIKLKAMVKGEQSLANTTHQIVTNSTAVLNDTKYYLSTDGNKNDIDTMVNKDNYNKTTYNGTLIPHKILNNSIAGETIIVSAVKVPSPIVKTLYNGSEKTAFDEFPIEFEVTTSAIIPSGTKYNKVEVVVYLPKYLRYTTSLLGTKPINPVIESNSEYSTLKFTFDSEIIASSDNNSDDNSVTFKFYADRAFDTPNSVEQEVKVKSNFFIQDKVNENLVYSSISSDESRTTTHKITIYNYGKTLTQAKVDPYLVEISKPYTYNMMAYNNSQNSANMEMLYILPYNGDLSGSNNGSMVSGSFSIRLSSQLPEGYKVYYTESDSKTILGNELEDISIPGSNNWKEWVNYTTNTPNIKAIKIVPSGNIEKQQYFISQDGISVIVTPNNNKIGDEYYNRFVMISSDSSNKSTSFTSSSSLVVSVYNRKISGFVFEDSDYNGLYLQNVENTKSDIPVEIYKIAKADAKKDSNVLEVMSSGDKLVGETTTNAEGVYQFKGLDSGLYYVKYTFDCNKYTTTDKLVVSDDLPNSSSVNSNANMLNDSCAAVSDIIELDNNNLEVSDVNLGLAIRKVFGVELKKYITQVVVNSNKGTQTYNYDNKNQVKIDIKNLKNTSFRVTYKFELKNSKYFPGYVNYIIESIPDGMTFDPSLSQNDGWVKSGNQLYYTKLSNVLISPGEKYYFSIVLDLSTETAGNYVNIISASDFRILGETVGEVDFSDIILDDVEDNSTDDTENE